MQVTKLAAFSLRENRALAICADCGKKIGFTQVRDGGVCPECFKARKRGETTPQIEAHQQLDADIQAVMLTTETYSEGLKITKRIEVVTAECAFGMNIFKDLFAGVRDIVGGRSEAVQKTLRDARRTALYELKKEAYEVGANAVVGVDLDYVELSAAGSMVLLVATGTAVRIEE